MQDNPGSLEGPLILLANDFKRTYLFENQSCRGRREWGLGCRMGREYLCFYVLVHSSHGHNGQSWDKSKPGSSSFFRIPWWLQVPQHLVFVLLLYQAYHDAGVAEALSAMSVLMSPSSSCLPKGTPVFTSYPSVSTACYSTIVESCSIYSPVLDFFHLASCLEELPVLMYVPIVHSCSLLCSATLYINLPVCHFIDSEHVSYFQFKAFISKATGNSSKPVFGEDLPSFILKISSLNTIPESLRMHSFNISGQWHEIFHGGWSHLLIKCESSMCRFLTNNFVSSLNFIWLKHCTEIY